MALENPASKHLYHIYKYFRYDHLPQNLKDISKPICDVADLMINTLPDNLEKAEGLRKLLEAKDCFVRAGLK